MLKLPNTELFGLTVFEIICTTHFSSPPYLHPNSDLIQNLTILWDIQTASNKNQTTVPIIETMHEKCHRVTHATPRIVQMFV